MFYVFMDVKEDCDNLFLYDLAEKCVNLSIWFVNSKAGFHYICLYFINLEQWPMNAYHGKYQHKNVMEYSSYTRDVQSSCNSNTIIRSLFII